MNMLVALVIFRACSPLVQPFLDLSVLLVDVKINGVVCDFLVAGINEGDE